MNESPHDRLTSLLPAPLEDHQRLVCSAALSIACVGGALLVGAVLLARVLPAGGGQFFVLKVLGFYLLLLLPLLAGLQAHLPHRRFGAANSITLVRAALVCLLAALYGERWSSHELLVACLALFAVSLDGVDGWLARRHGTLSRYGARFDMEADSLLVLVLSLLAWQSGKAGIWVLCAGLIRYAFLAAALLWRWLYRPLFASPRRKTICVLELIALITCIAPFLPDGWRLAAAAYGVLMVTWSFGLDILWLFRRRRLPMSDPPLPPGALDGAG